jgi:catechol 2,3-dioxygenase-like lactoylglutathione lyase family enzyme
MPDEIHGKLPDGAESGNRSEIGRRHLLHSLGLATTALLLPRSFAHTAIDSAIFRQRRSGADKAFPVTTVNHLALASKDYVKSRDFYVDLFGMRVAWDNGRGCALEFGSLTSPNGMYIRPAADGEKPTIEHIAFGIPNFRTQKAAMHEQLERRGIRNIHPDGEMGWSCLDPAGYPLDIWVPEKDKAMFPGAAAPCKIAASPMCIAAWEAGEKNLAAAPKPSSKSFKGLSYSFVRLHVPDLSRERDFYTDLLGMQVLYDGSQQPNDLCLLKFGQNTLELRKLPNASARPYCHQFGIAIESFNRADVETELKRRRLKPKPDSELSWSITDPDGYEIDVSAPEFSEHLANACHGNASTCSGSR